MEFATSECNNVIQLSASRSTEKISEYIHFTYIMKNSCVFGGVVCTVRFATA